MAYPKQPKQQPNTPEDIVKVAPVDAPSVPPVSLPGVQGGAPKVNTGTPLPAVPRNMMSPNDPAPQVTPPWQNADPRLPTHATRVAPSPWKVEDFVTDKVHGKFVAQLADSLYKQLTEMPAEQRQASTFWQGVAQNPQYMAAMVLRRMFTNQAVAQGQIKLPTIEDQVGTVMRNAGLQPDNSVVQRARELVRTSPTWAMSEWRRNGK